MLIAFDFLSRTSLWDAVIFKNKFLFGVYITFFGASILVSDGTPGGTTEFKKFWADHDYKYAYLWPDMYGAILSGSANWHNRLFNGKIFLFAVTATNSGTSSNLWITDGTIDNTVSVKVINPIDGSSVFVGSRVSSFYTQSGVYFAASK